MDRCQHCQHLVAPGAPYCSGCGRSRMMEGLLAPRERPAWQDVAWQAVTAVGLAWFLLVACVAFLREPKALRVARQAIELGQNEKIQQADTILNQFLAEHPHDEGGLFLSSRATVRLEDLSRTAKLRDRLREEDADLLDELDPDLDQAIDASIRSRVCAPDRLLAYYDQTDALGDDFRDAVLADMQDAIRRCVLSAGVDGKSNPGSMAASSGPMGAVQVTAGLVERKVDPEVIQNTFLVPLRTALGEGQYDYASALAVVAVLASPETGQTLDPAFKHVRGRIEASIARLDEVCRTISEAPERTEGKSNCFPVTAPAWLVTSRDGWGRPLAYKPLDPAEKGVCFRGFEVTSLGADGQATDEEDAGPNTDITCRFDGHRRKLTTPDTFWRRKS